MTPFSDFTFRTQHEDATKQITQLQHAISQNTRKLEKVQQQRRRVEEEILEITTETKQMVKLVMGNGKIVDALQQLGQLLQKEKDLSEQLNDQASANGDVQERCERFRTKVKNLSAEIVEVKQHLTEVKARNVPAQALPEAPACKSRRNQTKPK